MNRAPVIAIGLAGTAFVLAAAALGVVSHRDSGGGGTPVDRLVDGLTIRSLAVTYRSKFDRAGAHLGDGELAHKLGLGKRDTLVTLNGFELTTSIGMLDATFGRPASMFAEVSHDGAPPVIERWRIDWTTTEAGDSSLYPTPLPAPSPAPSPDPFAGGNLSGNPFDPPPPPPPDPVLDQIEKIDDTHYRIPSAVLDNVLANPVSVAKGARIVPAMKDGHPSGFKLYAIRPSSIYARLGLQNGDTLVQVNGMAMTNPESALEAYTKLRDATALTVEIIRRGQPVELSYEIAR